MARALTMELAAYRISVWGEPDPRWRRCTAFAAVLGVLTIVAVWVVPLRTVEITSIDQVPERLAKLILEEPAPPKAAPQAAPKPKVDVRGEAPPAPKPVTAPEPAAKPKPTPVEQVAQTPRRATAPARRSACSCSPCPRDGAAADLDHSRINATTAVVHSPRLCRYAPRIHTSAVRVSSQRGTSGRKLSTVESRVIASHVHVAPWSAVTPRNSS